MDNKGFYSNFFIPHKNYWMVGPNLYDTIFWIIGFLHLTNNNIDYWLNIIDKVHKDNGFLYKTNLNNYFGNNELKVMVASIWIFYKMLNLHNFWLIKECLYELVVSKKSYSIKNLRLCRFC